MVQEQLLLRVDYDMVVDKSYLLHKLMDFIYIE